MATILIVDDRPPNRYFLVKLLGYFGHQLFEASDGVEALLAAESVKPDLIICDIHMPRMDGYRFVSLLRTKPDTSSMPVIFYTATYREEEARLLARTCGVNWVLAKPSDPQTIITTVNEALGTAKAPTPAVIEQGALTTLGDQLSEQSQEVFQVGHKFSALLELGMDLTAERDSWRLTEHFCHAARSIIGARYAAVGLLDDTRSALRDYASDGFDVEAAARRPNAFVSAPLLDRLVKSRGIVRMQVGPDLSRIEGLPAGHPTLHSFLGVPLMLHDEPCGWLYLGDKVGADGFGDEDERIGSTIAAQLAVAYEFARLNETLKQRTAQLEHSDERRHFVLDATKIGIWEWDPATGAVEWSDTMSAVTGIEPHAFPTTYAEFVALIYPDDREEAETRIAKAMAEASFFTAEFRMAAADGSVRWVEDKGRMLNDADGRPSRGYGISMDVTERKQLEAQYRQAQKMEAIGQLAGGVAHDFNNLLTAILGYARFLDDSFDAKDARRGDVAEIRKAGERAALLTQQLLAFSRRQVLQPVILDLGDMVLDVTKMLRRVIGEHIEIKTGLARDLAKVKADPGQMQQVVMNLAVNARDAMPDGGRLLIETTNVSLDEGYAHTHASIAPGRYVMLSVTDTGIGMDADTQRRVFEPFFTTKPMGKGTGLGLSTVYGIVKQSGGNVWVYSEPGRGTSFKVYLPAADEEAEARQAELKADAAGGHEMILLVEDDESVRALARRILESKGYRVVEAGSSKDALATIARHVGTIDLLVTDVVMPGGTGPELYRQLSSERPNLKVLFMSGYSDDAIAIREEVALGSRFLQKPFDTESLARKVRETLDA